MSQKNEVVQNPPGTRQKIVVIGSGGHGVTSLSQLIKHQAYDHYVYYNTGDWGGSWGLWGRLLEFNNHELNIILHGQPLDVLPFADLNKAICHFIDVEEKKDSNQSTQEDNSIVDKQINLRGEYKTGNRNRSVLDFRSEELKEQKLNIKLLFEIVKFDKNEQISFQIYFDTAWKFYQSNKFKLKYIQSFCLGYVLQMYVYNKAVNLVKIHDSNDAMFFWNKFWQDLEILPTNVYLDFTSKNRQIMTARDLSLSKLAGEDRIDSYHSPILPETMVFENIDESLAKPKKSFLKILKLADLVIIPNGSVGNWLSIINYQKVKIILQEKQIIWLTNPYRNKNELINPNYILFFTECGINVKAFVPIKNSQNNSFMNVLEQDKHGRYIPEQVSQEVLNVFKSLNDK